MKYTRTVALAASFAFALVAPAALHAQATDTSHHAGGVTAAANDVSGASKSAGRGAKSAIKSAGSATHHVLKTTGRNIKAGLKTATGDTAKPDPNHKPGGLNKVARDVSEAGKSVGRSVKSGVHTAGSDTHHALQTTGNAAKASVKDSTH